MCFKCRSQISLLAVTQKSFVMVTPVETLKIRKMALSIFFLSIQLFVGVKVSPQQRWVKLQLFRPLNSQNLGQFFSQTSIWYLNKRLSKLVYGNHSQPSLIFAGDARKSWPRSGADTGLWVQQDPKEKIRVGGCKSFHLNFRSWINYSSQVHSCRFWLRCRQGILRGGSITVPLTSCLTGLEYQLYDN